MQVCVYCIRPGGTGRIEGQGVDRANTGNPKHCTFAVGKYDCILAITSEPVS